MIHPFDSAKPYFDKLLSMFRGMNRVPKLARDHLHRCESDPDHCVLCAFILRYIEDEEKWP